MIFQRPAMAVIKSYLSKTGLVVGGGTACHQNEDKAASRPRRGASRPHEKGHRLAHTLTVAADRAYCGSVRVPNAQEFPRVTGCAGRSRDPLRAENPTSTLVSAVVPGGTDGAGGCRGQAADGHQALSSAHVRIPSHYHDAFLLKEAPTVQGKEEGRHGHRSSHGHARSRPAFAGHSPLRRAIARYGGRRPVHQGHPHI